MPSFNSTTAPSSNSRTGESSDISNPEEQDIWFDAIDHVEMDETWFDARGSHHTDPVSAGEIADSRVPFTEDCRRCVQQLIRTVGRYEESRILSGCLAGILPGTPVSLVMAGNSLYSAITGQRNIDVAALHALGLASWCIPDNINIVSQLAVFIRDTVTTWTDETFLQQILGNEENQTSTHLFTALAVTTIVAGRWMKDEGAPQRGLLKIPAFAANIFIRASHYWNALGNMTRSAPPSSSETRENPESIRRAPALEVDTCVEMTGDICDAAVSCFPSEPRITAFSSNSTATSEAYTRAMVRNRTASVSGGNYPLPIPEQAHSLAVEKLRQESGLSDLLYCTTRKTETSHQTNGKVITDTYFNMKCDATAYPESMSKFAENTNIQKTQVSSATTSPSGKDVLQSNSPLSTTSDNSVFVSDRDLSPSVSENAAHTVTGGNIFGAMLNPLANTLYETGQLISRYDPFRFPGAEALPIKENNNDNMLKDTRNNRHVQHKLRDNPTKRANHRITKLLRGDFLPYTGRVSKEKLLYAVSACIFNGKNGIAGHENKVNILARKILSANNLYGEKDNEPLSTAQAKFTVRRWAFENILGMAPDKYIESKMKADTYPDYYTIGSIHHFLPMDKLPTGSRIHSERMASSESTMLLTMWKSFLTEEMPFLNLSKESVKTIQLNSYDFANLYSGSRFLRTVSDKDFTAEEAMATGEIMWDLAVNEGGTEDKLAYHLAPALFFTASISPRNVKLDLVNDFDAVNRYLQYRKEVSDVKKDIKKKYDTYLSATTKWLSRGNLADYIISQCPTLSPGRPDQADAIRTAEQKREKAERSAKQYYLNGMEKPCQSAPESLDHEYHKLTAESADGFREIDKYLILSAISILSEDERKFIQSPDATIHHANAYIQMRQPDSTFVAHKHFVKRTDLFSVKQENEERIYALKAEKNNNNGYKLIRVDRDIKQYISSGVLGKNFNDYKITWNKIEDSQDIANFGVTIIEPALTGSGGNINLITDSLSKKHRDNLYSALHEAGNDKSDIQKTWNVVKHIIPFYDCVEGIINNDPGQAVPSCLMDAMAFIPVFARAASLSAKFGMGLARGLRSGAIIVGKEGIISAGNNLLREISLPTTAELALLGKGTLKAIDPGFEQIVSITSISGKFCNKMVNLMSGNKKTAALAQEIASSRVLDRLPQIPADVKTMGILPETQLQVPVKVIGKQGGRAIYVHVNPETGAVGGAKYFCSKNGNLQLVSIAPGKNNLLKNTSNRVTRGIGNSNLCTESGESSITSSSHKRISNQQRAEQLIREKEVLKHEDMLKAQKKNEDAAIANNAINNKFNFIELRMSQVQTVNDATSVLFTTGLSDCSALAIVSDWNGSIYESRTLMHLGGSSVQLGLGNFKDASKLISDIKDGLVNGGKAIWVGGLSSQSQTGLLISIGQRNNNNEQPILDLFNTNGVSVEIAGANGVTVYPDGKFDIDNFGRGFLTEQEKQTLKQKLLDY